MSENQNENAMTVSGIQLIPFDEMSTEKKTRSPADTEGPIEFQRAITEQEIRVHYLNLTDDSGMTYGRCLPDQGTEIIVVDHRGKRLNAKKSGGNQIWGNLWKQYESNNITTGTKILVRFDPKEKIDGKPVVRLVKIEGSFGTTLIQEKILVPRDIEWGVLSIKEENRKHFPKPGEPVVIIDYKGRPYSTHMHNTILRIDGLTDLYRNYGHWNLTPDVDTCKIFATDKENEYKVFFVKGKNTRIQSKNDKCFFYGRKCANFKIMGKCVKCFHLDGDLRLDCMFE